MVGKSGGSGRTRSKSVSDMSTIAAALVPAVVFSAVPRSPPPVFTPNPKSSMLVKDMLSTSAVGRLSNTAPPVMDEAFSDPDSSLYDYQHMNDPGYSTVDFGTLERRRQMERNRLGTPPDTPREMNEAEGQSFGNRYHILESSEIQQELEAEVEEDKTDFPLYAVPHKVVNSQKKLHRHSGLVQAAMNDQIEYEPSMDESAAMKRYHQEDIEATPQTLRKTAPNTAREVREAMIAVRNLPAIESEENINKNALDKNSSELKDSIRRLKADDISIERQQEVLRRLEIQIAELHKYSEELFMENNAIRKGSAANVDVGAGTGSQTLKKQLLDLKDDCKVLKNTVHRLNIELSKYQAKYRPVQYGNEAQEIVGLPSKGPIPSWLINTKYLAPLFLAYDDELNKKQKAVQQYEEIMESIRVRTEELVKENENLRTNKTEHSANGPQWDQLQEQARLVLEENQILMEQIDVQQKKFRELYKGHSNEMAKLSKQVLSLTNEKTEKDQELVELHKTLRETQEKFSSSVTQTEDKTNHTLIEIKRTLIETKETHSKEKEDLSTKYQALQLERKNLAYEVADLMARNSQLETELKSQQKTVKKVHGKVTLMNKALEMSENKELSAHEHLSNLIKLAERNAFERDTYAKVAKDKEHENRKALNRLVEGNVTVGKLEEKLKMYKVKAATKLNSVASRLSEQGSKFQSERLEYEREIKHLRLLLKEKELLLQSADSEKRAVEEDLEVMWQAANSENQMIQDTMKKSLRKLRHHQGLRGVCEPDNKELLTVSSDEEFDVDK